MKSMLALSIFLMSILHADWKRIIGPSDAPVPPDKKVMKSDTLCVYIRATIFGFTEEDTTIDSKDFKRVAIPDEDVDWDTLNIGKPQIPFIRMLIAVPDSAVFDLEMHSGDYTVFEDYLIYPVPRIAYKDTAGCACSEEIYTYDTNFYEKDTVYPGKFYELMSDGYWRDQRVLEVLLYPIQVNPKQKLMYFYGFLDLRIDYSGTVVENENGLGPFEEIGRRILLNYPGIAREPESVPEPAFHYYTELEDTTNVADYLVVMGTDFYYNETASYWIEQLAQWRVDHNEFNVGLVKMEDVYEQFDSLAPDSAAQLRDFLIYAYNNWQAPSIPDGHFAYCLFIGDWDYVPTKLYEYTVEDNEMLGAREGYFRNFDGVGDEIMLGRFPVKITDVTDLVAIVKKTINYEEYPDTTDNWRRRGLLIAGGRDGGLAFDRSVTSSAPYFTDIGYDTLTVRWTDLGPDSAAFCDSIQKHINNGVLLTAYYDHGAPGGWWGGYDTAWVKRLSNGDTLGDSLTVVLSYACLTAMFQWDHPFYSEDSTHLWYNPGGVSFGEHFIFNPDGGAVLFGGSTIYGGFPTKTMLRRILRDQMWIIGESFATSGSANETSCLLGDPALDLGDYTAYPHLPDLVVRPSGTDILLDRPYPYPGINDTIPIHFKVYNIGAVKAESVDVKVEVMLEEGVIYDSIITFDEIMARDSAVATVYWNTAATHSDYCGEIGLCWFVVTADPEDEIIEAWPHNNGSSIIKRVILYPNQPGWPIRVTGFAEPAIANLDGSGSVEIVYPQADSVWVYDNDGNVLTDWPQYFKNVQALVLGDIDDNDIVEIVAVSPDTIKVYDHQGDILPGWPQAIPASDYTFTGLPALGHIDAVDSPEIIVLGLPVNASTVYVKVFVFENDGTLRHEFTSEGSYVVQEEETTIKGVSIGDVLPTARDEIVISYGRETSRFFTEIFDSTGSRSVLDYGSNRVVPAVVDLNNAGRADVVIGCADGMMRAYDAMNDVILWECQTSGPINSSPAVGNVHPGIPYPGVEVTFGNDSSEVHLRSGASGNNIPPWWYTAAAGSMIRTSASISDIDGDGNLEIITSVPSTILAFGYNKTLIAPFPFSLLGIASSVIIGDIDGDQLSEVIFSSSDGYLHVWENRESRVTPYTLEWPQVQHDQQRTGLYGW